MKQENWIWMPHHGHFICGSHCRFKLNTCVGKYIVSTVGEWVPDSQIRDMFAKIRGIELVGQGDAREADWLTKAGFEDIGVGRKYETMVFRSKKSTNGCCPYEMAKGRELDFKGYNKAEDAYKGHMELCQKWSEE